MGQAKDPQGHLARRMCSKNIQCLVAVGTAKLFLQKILTLLFCVFLCSFVYISENFLSAMCLMLCGAFVRHIVIMSKKLLSHQVWSVLGYLDCYSTVHELKVLMSKAFSLYCAVVTGEVCKRFFFCVLSLAGAHAVFYALGRGCAKYIFCKSLTTNNQAFFFSFLSFLFFYR